LAEIDGFITFVVLLLIFVFIPIVKVKYHENLIQSLYDADLNAIFTREKEYKKKQKEWDNQLINKKLKSFARRGTSRKDQS